MLIPAVISKAFSKKSTPPQVIGDIPYVDFVRIFQVFTGKIYDIDENPAIDDDMVEIFTQSYLTASMPVYDFLKHDKDRTKVNIHSHLSKHNGYISYMEITHTVVEEGDRTIGTLVICDGDNYTPRPHVGISGIISNTENGVGFIPLDAACLTTDKTTPYMLASDTQTFMGIINYANQALIQILAGEEPNIVKNEKFVSHKYLARADFEYQKITNRNFQRLLKDVEDYKSSNKTPEKTYATGPVINT